MEIPICYLLEMMQEKQNEGSRMLISDCNFKNVCVVWLRTAANERGKEVRALSDIHYEQYHALCYTCYRIQYHEIQSKRHFIAIIKYGV